MKQQMIVKTQGIIMNKNYIAFFLLAIVCHQQPINTGQLVTIIYDFFQLKLSSAERYSKTEDAG